MSAGPTSFIRFTNVSEEGFTLLLHLVSEGIYQCMAVTICEVMYIPCLWFVLLLALFVSSACFFLHLSEGT